MVVSLFKKLGALLSLNDPRWGGNSGDKNSGNEGNQPNPPNQPDQPNNQPGQQNRPNRPDRPDRPHQPQNDIEELEQMWRDFTRHVGRLLGLDKKPPPPPPSGDGKPPAPTPNPKNGKRGFSFIAVVAVAIWLSSGFFVVQEGQTGVVLTFGKYSHDAPAGFNWRWPYPIQSNEIVNVSQVRTVEVGYFGDVKEKRPKEALMLTDDENIIDIQFAVQYRLKSAPDWIFNNREQESTVKQVAETAIREVVGRSKMDFVLYEGREKVATDVAQLMQQILDRFKSGVQVTNVTMQNVQPPEQVQAAFDDAVKAGQDRERQKNEGQAYANDVIPKARGAAARLKEESEAYRARVVADAQGNAERFKQVLVEYQKAPVVTRDRMYLDTMQHIFTNTTKLMVDTKSNSNMIYLPLDKIIGQTLSPDASTPSTTSATTPKPTTTNPTVIPTMPDPYSRDRESR
jgi:membrane protease subunit HflK